MTRVDSSWVQGDSGGFLKHEFPHVSGFLGSSQDCTRQSEAMEPHVASWLVPPSLISIVQIVLHGQVRYQRGKEVFSVYIIDHMQRTCDYVMGKDEES